MPIPAPSVQIRFEAAFELVEPGSNGMVLDPSRQEWDDLIPVLVLRHDRIASAVATHDGQLDVEFTSSRRLPAKPAPHYENWAVSGSGFQLISLPVGGVAVFAGEPDGPLPK